MPRFGDTTTGQTSRQIFMCDVSNDVVCKVTPFGEGKFRINI